MAIFDNVTDLADMLRIENETDYPHIAGLLKPAAEREMCIRDRYRDILRWRYVNGWKWERIAKEMNYSDMKWLWNLHRRALEALEVPPLKHD